MAIGFLTAMRQEVTRAHKGWALDTVTLHNDVLKQSKEEITASPAVSSLMQNTIIDTTCTRCSFPFLPQCHPSFSVSGGGLRLWFVPGRGRLGQKELPSHRSHSQGVVLSPACDSHVCHQLHRPQGPQVLHLPRLQEASAHRPHLHHRGCDTHGAVTRSLDLTWCCLAL